MTKLLDFESVSDCDLQAHGGRLYAEHPSTEALVCVWTDTETGEVDAWFPGMSPPITRRDDVAAHNWDRFDRYMAARYGWPTPRAEIDTSHLARRGGLPGALNALGTRWFGIEKDEIGSKYTISLSGYDDIADAMPPGFDDGETDHRPPTTKSKKPWSELGASTRSKWARDAWMRLPKHERRRRVLGVVTDYCGSDVQILDAAWPSLQPYLTDGVFGGWEADVLAVDRTINERGVEFDAPLAKRLLECDSRLCDEAIGKAAKAWGETFERTRDLVYSPVELAAVLGTEDAKAETIEAIVKNRETPEDVRLLAMARQATASIVSGKLRAGLNRVSPDSRLRDELLYYGGHTGRWSHKGMQLGNMSRPAKRFEDEGWGDVEICNFVDVVMAGHWPDADEIELLMRACLGGNAVCDFSGVEARFLAWCANDRKAIANFLGGRDVYKVAAAQIFGRSYDEISKTERQVGKVAELACGYGMGHRKFYDNNADALDAAGVSAKDVVEGWRTLHAPIVRYWYQLEDAFKAAVKGTASEVWPFSFVPSDDGRDVAIFLPSGRPIVYNEVGISREQKWGKARESLHYVGHRGRTYLYGGKIAENVVQAGCRDLLADALVRTEAAGLNPVLHVHDEIVCDVPFEHAEEAAAELQQIMTTLPEWAEGFPVGAAGHWGRRYRK